MSLTSFPEELLEKILADAVITPASPHPRALWHTSFASSGKQYRGRVAPLLVSRTFHRIALPFFYHTLVLHSPSQSAALLTALRARPSLARAVRTLVLPVPCQTDAEVLRLLPGLLTLDIALPDASDAPPDALASSTRALRTLRVLTVRKGARTYLSQPAPRAVLDAIADVVEGCIELHTFTLNFPLSSAPALARLAAALSSAPALATFRTSLPAVWAPAYASVAANAALERICLGDDLRSSAPSAYSCTSSSFSVPTSPSATASRPERRATHTHTYSYTSSDPCPILSTSLFLSAARPHAHLAALIRAGTTITPAASGWRGRAATVGGGGGTGGVASYGAGGDGGEREAEAHKEGTC